MSTHLWYLRIVQDTETVSIMVVAVGNGELLLVGQSQFCKNKFLWMDSGD